MWKKITLAAIVVVLLSLAFLIFSFSMLSSQDIVAEIIHNIQESLSIQEPEYVKLTIYLMESDLGHSMTYFGNETASATPIPNAFVRIGGEVTFTNNGGEAYIIIPKGNYTLSIARKRGADSVWETSINVVSDGEVNITFYRFRVEASSINAYPQPFKGLSNVKIAFKLPTIGIYYVGEPTITYYTPWGQLRVHYRDLEISEGISLDNVWDLVEINYRRVESGGQTIEFIEEVRGFPTYIHPKYSFLPVEKVEVEEKWLR